MPMALRQSVQHVLRRLREAEGFVSGEDLSRELAVSRMTVSNAVGCLRELGYGIESVPHRGYRLHSITDRPLAWEVQPLLRTSALGRAWVYDHEMASTNRVAFELAAAGAPHGLVVTADCQAQGKGRLGRSWHSPAGRNLYVSVVLRPRLPAARVPQVSLVTALAVRRVLAAAHPGLAFGVKWPNDVWVGQRKIAGILCEMDAELDRVRHIVVGLGLNVNWRADEMPAELAASATSLLAETGAVTPRPPLLAALLNAFEEVLDVWSAAADLQPLAAEMERHALLTGRRVRLEIGRHTLCGVVTGMAADGRLRLQPDDGPEQLVGSGEAHLAAGMRAPPP
ncbi:MAG: biotin--[acetyl-CoA-carboxylase] ligase [Lentisphaeria bacterium]|nr:biotin--[acetyl-CoA-carboxylase] ligase [Lentisphaeria bacterium]